ncbi:unnamed protein product [Caenorhabditis sp. 36 PRJEB53466]|nr:unnamed protein product [Caenorhabditis sp. 36 PRJEB53466]
MAAQLSAALLLLLTSMARTETIGMSEELVDRAVRSCCDIHRHSCCKDSISYKYPIRCGFEAIPLLPIQIHDCIQGVLFENAPEKRLGLDYAACCSVYGHPGDEFDFHCQRNCNKSMSAPSLDRETKIERAMSCKVWEHPRDKCFTKCMEIRKRGIKIEVLRFKEYCDLTKPTTTTVSTTTITGTVLSSFFNFFTWTSEPISLLAFLIISTLTLSFWKIKSILYVNVDVDSTTSPSSTPKPTYDGEFLSRIPVKHCNSTAGLLFVMQFCPKLCPFGSYPKHEEFCKYGTSPYHIKRMCCPDFGMYYND